MKEIVKEEDSVIQASMEEFEQAVDKLAAYLYATPSVDVTLEDLSTMIDVDSFAKYYLVNAYALNDEGFVSSFYWYKDGPQDVIHLGPIWDFDTCMGSHNLPYTDESIACDHILFNYLLSAPAFYARTQELWEQYQQDFFAMTAKVDELKALLKDSAKMNYLRWDTLGKSNPKGGADFQPTFEEATNTLRAWLDGREESFFIAKGNAVTATVSDDCYLVELCLQDNGYKNVRLAVWSDVGGQDDLTWYNAQKGSDDAWHYTVDLSRHSSAGVYYIDAYEGNQLIAFGCGYVEIAHEPRYTTSITVAEDCKTMQISMKDATGSCNFVSFAVWSEEGGQNDLKWYTADLDEEGNWVYTVELTSHNSAGKYFVHVYSGRGEDCVLADFVDADVAFAVAPTSPTLEPSIPTVPMFRLFNPNTGEHFYTGSEEERDSLVKEGWNYEGVAWNAPIYDGDPVYRMFNPNSGDHHYTMSQQEVEDLKIAGWNYEGVAWNSAVASKFNVPQYRLYNPNAKTGIHHYTSSEEERSNLVDAGWKYEGIGWYGTLK